MREQFGTRSIAGANPMPDFLADDGVSLHYIVSGAGPVEMICLHWMGGAGATWEVFCGALDPIKFRCVALDFRGHGKSQPTASLFTIERLARDVLNLADVLGFDRFAVAGHSFGGKVALRVAALAPQRVKGLVLIGGVGPGLVPLERPMIDGILERSGDVSFVREVFRGWFQVWPRVEIDDALERFAGTPAWALRAVCESALWSDIAADVGEVLAPALVIAGDADPVYGPTYQEQSVRPFLSNATCVTMAGCGHGLILERPEEIAVHIEGFLGQLR